MEALIRAGALDSLDPAVDRAQLLATLPHAIDCADQADAQLGQDSLFGAIDETFDAPRQWVQVAPWTERQRLREEKAALGFYFSGHLFDAHRDEVQRMVRGRLVDLAPSREPQWLAGTIAALRTQMTRRGKMLIVTLDDGSAKVEISVFAELHERFRTLLREDEFLLVQGRVSNDEYAGGLRVSADRVLDLTAARMQFARRLRIQLNGQSHAGRLHELLAPYQEGPPAEVLGCPVEIEYHTASARCRIALGDAWRVRPDDALLGALRQWLTADCAELLYE
jgi:DNA polymerase-3 subunit alpha